LCIVIIVYSDHDNGYRNCTQSSCCRATGGAAEGQRRAGRRRPAGRRVGAGEEEEAEETRAARAPFRHFLEQQVGKREGVLKQTMH